MMEKFNVYFVSEQLLQLLKNEKKMSQSRISNIKVVGLRVIQKHFEDSGCCWFIIKTDPPLTSKPDPPPGSKTPKYLHWTLKI